MVERTVAFFLEDSPMGVCEVVAIEDGDTLNIRGSCHEAQQNHLRCKHCRAIAQQFADTGKIATEIDASVPRSVIQKCKHDADMYRELVLKRGKVLWVGDE